jgi:LacI family transcriptional regulator
MRITESDAAVQDPSPSGGPGLGSDRTGRATIRDVATRAGVSTATVSRVLAGIGNSKAETAAAVMEAVQELGYRPSGVARSLRMRRTRTLGLIVTDIQNPFFPELVQAADDAARSIGYSILLGSAAYDEHRAMHYLDLMVDRRVDGMIIASSQLSQASWRWLLDSPVPVVVANAEPAGLPVTVITADNAGGMEAATQHLTGLGHRKIAFIGAPANYTPAAVRVEGFMRGCAAAGLDPDDTPILDGDGAFDGGEAAAQRLLAVCPDVTAIACYNDLTAIGALRALRAAGRRVPEDVSVIGCDDIAAASWVSPTLTTVAQQKAEMGRLAIDRLAAALDDPEHAQPPETIRLAMQLVERESTGPAPHRS